MMLLSCLLSTVVMANAQGINFQKNKSWDEVVALAKKSKKYIFVNCYMLEGKPCIEMAENVFPKKVVGDFYNKNFVNVSIDMDIAATDAVSTARKADADTIRGRYHVNGYPNYLFINPEGKIVHQYIGSQSPEDFIRTGKDALNPKKQLYTRIDAFKAGARDTAVMLQLIKETSNLSMAEAKELTEAYLALKSDADQANPQDISIIQFVLRDRERAQKLAAQYISGLTPAQKMEAGNVNFILFNDPDQESAVKLATAFVDQAPDSLMLKNSQNVRTAARLATLQGVNSASFKFLQRNRTAAEKVLGMSGSLNGMMDKLIFAELVVPVMKPASTSGVAEMDWLQLEKDLAEKVSATDANRNVMGAKIEWYAFKKNWPEFTKTIVLMDKKYGDMLADYEVSSKVAFPIFMRSKQEEELQYALGRLSPIVKHASASPGQLHAYANLLYKTGKKDEAIQYEKKAQSLMPDNKSFQDALEKMNSGKPTWEEN